jgi:hypothetical protein
MKHSAHSIPRFWRTAGLGLAATVVVAAGLPGGASGVAMAESLGLGSGRAAAKLVKVGPSRGALTLSPQVGLALSDFLNTRGRGDVRMADFAALEDSVPREIRDGLPAVKVESTDENAEEGQTVTVGTPPEVPLKVGAAELHADAGAAPYGASSFAAGVIDLGIGTMSGARATARSGVVDGNVREAVATVVIPRLELADGAVVLEDVAWRAVHRTGADQVERATFSIGAATVGGQAVDAPAGSDLPLADVSAAVEPVLTPLGLQLSFPQARTDPGSVSLSPLRLRVSKSVAAPALVPIFDAIQPVREPLVDAIRSGTDQADAAILLSDIALGVLTGGSNLDIELGGVTAATAEPAAAFRFGTAGGFDLGATGPGTATIGATGPGLGMPDAPSPLPAAGGARTSGDSGGDLVSEARPASSSSARRGGALLMVGLAGLLAAAAMALADYRRIRAGSRIIPA